MCVVKVWSLQCKAGEQSALCLFAQWLQLPEVKIHGKQFVLVYIGQLAVAASSVRTLPCAVRAVSGAWFKGGKPPPPSEPRESSNSQRGSGAVG